MRKFHKIQRIIFTMANFIKMLSKKSGLAAFLFERLMNKTHKNCLFWEPEEYLTFNIICTHKRKKHWIAEVELIFEEYITFKNLTSSASLKGKRTTFLQALKSSKYINIDTTHSNSDKKVCRFTERFETLLNNYMQTTGEENHLVYTQPVVPEMNIESPVPMDAQQSFYDEYNRSQNLNSTPNGQGDLNEPEESVSFGSNGAISEMIPANYEPLQDIICSRNMDSPLNSLDLFTIGQGVQILQIRNVSVNGDQVRILDENGANSSPSLPRNIMVTLKPPSAV